MQVCIKYSLLFILCSAVLQSSNEAENFNGYPQPGDKWIFRMHGGYATVRPLMAIIMLGDVRLEKRYTSIRGIDIGRDLVHGLRGYPLDLSLRIGIINHNEKGFQPDQNQYNVFLLGHYRTTFRGRKMRWFLGEGLSYAEQVPYVEGRDVRRMSEERDSQLQNYLNVGFDLSLGHLFLNPALDNITVGFAISHRSGIFGAFKWFNYTSGGGNFNTLFLEYKL